MTFVWAHVDDVPELAAALERRRSSGLDTCDEWWKGVYRIVTGPKPEHGEATIELAHLFRRGADAAGLLVGTTTNVGVDRVDARVTDVSAYRPGAPRTSPAFLGEVLLAVEILSAGEEPAAKLDFYATWGAVEYLEVDLEGDTQRLLVRSGATWVDSDVSALLGFTVDEVRTALDGIRRRMRGA